LSADDITALRMADSITFHHGPPNARYVATCVRAHLSGGFSDEPRIWTAREQRLFPSGDTGGGRDRLREVTPERSTVTGYDWPAGTFPDAQAFHMMHSITPEWATIASLLRAGDTLRVSWRADNNNENHTGAGFHQDELRLSVHRGARVMNFLITKSVGPDNSARMIRREGS
jgi:hypothetical protein